MPSGKNPDYNKRNASEYKYFHWSHGSAKCSIDCARTWMRLMWLIDHETIAQLEWIIFYRQIQISARHERKCKIVEKAHTHARAHTNTRAHPTIKRFCLFGKSFHVRTESRVYRRENMLFILALLLNSMPSKREKCMRYAHSRTHVRCIAFNEGTQPKRGVSRCEHDKHH